MKPLLIIKVGSSLPDIVATRGDFDDWFAAKTRWSGPVRVVRRPGQGLPEPEGAAAIIVTGSAAMVTSREAWSTATGSWLAGAASSGVPILAVCYGHQLIAEALGGRVGRNPGGREIGTIEVELNSAAQSDALFAGLPSTLRVQATHVESVLELPPGAVVLGSNPHDSHQAVRFGPRVWGVQFHPEFDAEIVRGYIEGRRDALLREGLLPNELFDRACDSGHGGALLERFASLAN